MDGLLDFVEAVSARCTAVLREPVTDLPDLGEALEQLLVPAAILLGAYALASAQEDGGGDEQLHNGLTQIGEIRDRLPQHRGAPGRDGLHEVQQSIHGPSLGAASFPRSHSAPLAPRHPQAGLPHHPGRSPARWDQDMIDYASWFVAHEVIASIPFTFGYHPQESI